MTQLSSKSAGTKEVPAAFALGDLLDAIKQIINMQAQLVTAVSALQAAATASVAATPGEPTVELPEDVPTVDLLTLTLTVIAPIIEQLAAAPPPVITPVTIIEQPAVAPTHPIITSIAEPMATVNPVTLIEQPATAPPLPIITTTPAITTAPVLQLPTAVPLPPVIIDAPVPHATMAAVAFGRPPAYHVVAVGAAVQPPPPPPPAPPVAAPVIPLPAAPCWYIVVKGHAVGVF
ncbi:hypothetical protein BKA93DRAFT_828820 [Sparassis latifolia]